MLAVDSISVLLTTAKNDLTTEETGLLRSLHIAGGRKNLPASQYRMKYDHLEQEGLVTAASAGVNIVVVEVTAKGKALAAQLF